MRFGYIDLWRVEDGRFTETWVQMDALGLMQQIGALLLQTDRAELEAGWSAYR